MNPIIIIILISVAGPLIGSLIGVLKKPSERYMFNLLSFAAGVMIAVSFLELIPEALNLTSTWFVVIGIILGSLVMFGLDRLIPHLHPGLCGQEQGHKLGKTAAYLLWGIFLHNFPEGLAMGVGSVTAIKVSFVIAIAIAIHDIPEGICTSAPFFFVTKKRMKSFLVSAATAIPTVIGFLAAYYFFPKLPMGLVGSLVAATAGVMIYISADELIPTSCCKMSDHTTIFSLIAGVLAVVLLGLI